MNNVKKCEYRNGVRRPLKGDTSKVWDFIESFVAKNKSTTPTLSYLCEKLPYINYNTIRTNLNQFLNFHGIKTRRGDLKNDRSFLIEKA